MRDDVTPARIRAARLVAVGADLLQIVLLPTFFPGVMSPAADAIDLVVAALMLWLVGWHWAFLPTFLAEVVPFVDLVPTWTAAVFLVTRSRAGPAPAPEVVVSPPAKGSEPPRVLPAGPQAPRDPSGS